MAKPRIFLSSTCFDLGDARAELTTFLEGYGFEVLNSQLGSFGVNPKTHSHDACLDMVENADYVVLIVGGRRGGTYVGSEKSITNEEIRRARKLERPVLAFVDQKVESLRSVYRKNPGANFAPTVDDVRIFDFIDDISAQEDNNWLHPFGNVVDIKKTLAAQFAYYLLCYSQGLRKPAKATAKTGKPLAFPATLDGVPGDDEDERTLMKRSLRQVHDGLKKLLESDVKDSEKQEQMKSIWIIARHGNAHDNRLQMSEDAFKGRAWGVSRGKRVFRQIPQNSGISAGYDVDHDDMDQAYGTVELRFVKAKDDNMPGVALKTWVEALLDRYGEDEALDYFKRLDMRIFADATPDAKGKAKAA